ncbi:MAG: DUF1579 domain-containing protein [Verrucomicrobiota bacterium]
MKNQSNSGGAATAQKPDFNSEEVRKKVEAAATPSAGHKALEPLVGDWKAEVKCWMDPDGPPHISKATATTKWTLNGHFIEEEFHGEMMGRPFTGRSLTGYDNTKQVYQSVWLSDMQTSMFTSAGKGENGNKVITLLGTTTCAATGRKDVSIKTVFRVSDSNRHTFEMFDEDKGLRTMEIIYTRK